MNLTKQFEESPFEGYAYGYPHKTAYRRLDRPRELKPLWQHESESRFFYLHLPFCEMRCGFCNLFTTTGAKEDWVDHYLLALERQLRMAAEFTSARQFVKRAIGGGTPTFLTVSQLDRLFGIINSTLGDFVTGTPLSVETSPGTVTADRLKCLRDHGATRVSIGVQSFHLEETRSLGRPQDPATLRHALSLLEAGGFDVLNLDLIYGIPGQTMATWQHSLEESIRINPGEVYLYPLYVRPLTGLDKLHRKPHDARLEYYRFGRDFLKAHGYDQISMRLFRRPTVAAHGLDYCCQEDGMMGFGAGARSYTRALHYSSEYAVGRTGVRSIIQHFIEADTAEFRAADYGCELDEEEQRRRYVIKSLLRSDGLRLDPYRAYFESDASADFPELQLLVNEDLASLSADTLRLTARGLELSDAIGPWLFSNTTKDRMKLFDLS